MADVFVSYASSDRDRILPIVRALENEGLTVWWDREILAGASWDREIEREIGEAGCVVVVWSTSSVDSEYVRSEADEASDRNILVPVLIDDVRPPLAHRRRQAAILTGGLDAGSNEFEKLVTSIRSILGNADTPDPAGGATYDGRYRVRRHIWPMVLGLFLLLGGSAMYYRDSIMMNLTLSAPSLFFGKPIAQQIGFATTTDGIRIAYATSGNGPPILQILSVGTHLENGQSSPIYDNEGLLAMSSRSNRFIRYDGRGTGLSDRDVGDDFSLDARLRDLDAVVDALQLDRFGVLGISAGGQAAIAYTALHPDRVTRLVLAGAASYYRFGPNGDPRFTREMLDLIEVGWERPDVPRLFADNLLSPGGDEVQRRFVGEMLQRANTGSMLAAFYRASAEIDVSDYARSIRVPTLVIQASDDVIVPLDEGRIQASLIPGARLELVKGGHMSSSASTAATRRLALDFLNQSAH